MGEILFKGKRVIDGKWAESCCPLGEMHSGTVTYDFESKTVCQYTGLNDNTRWEELSENDKEKFLSEWNYKEDRQNTKEDWNGRKIFEGDIVKAILLPYNKDGYSVGYIVFERGTFKVYITKSMHKGEYTKYAEEDAKTYSIENNFLKRGYVLEVIGNIFDNPELLEVENEID